MSTQPRASINADGEGLHVLVVDDEEPARADLEYLLYRQPAIARVTAAADATEALRQLQADQFDGVFLDVRMPGLNGLELARVLRRFSTPPVVVFVTAHESHAIAAFEARARGYLLKPVSSERLADAVALIEEARQGRPRRPESELASNAVDDMATVPVESNGRTFIVERSEVCWLQANGDYVRLHTTHGSSHLVRLPLALFEERWAAHGFVRIHRSHLVALRYISELRTGSAGGAIVRVNGHDLAVSRRHTAELRHRLLRVPANGRSE
jgi:DNA-binding LytR/AlgR family response regulator